MISYVYVFISLFSSSVIAQSMIFEGTLYDSNSSPVSEPGVKVKAEIFDSTLSCVLYEREYTLDLSSSKGHFKIDLSAGTAPVGQPHSSNTLAKVISNANDNNVTCADSSVKGFTGTYTKRRIRLTILEIDSVNIADIQLAAQDLDLVPFANEAETAKAFTGSLTGDVSGTASATKVEKIQNVEVDPTPPTDRQILKYDAGTTKYVPSSIDSAVIQDGSISVDDVDFASEKGINVPSQAAAPGAPAAGQIYYNSVDNKVYFYNGSNWIDTGASGGDFKADGTVSATGNLRLNGNFLSGDGDSEGIFVSSAGDVGVGTASPSSTALLELSSTSKGFLPPRMTTAQRNGITSPTAGLVVFDTDENSIYSYSGTSWVRLGGAQFAFRAHLNGVDQSKTGGSYQVVNFTAETLDSENAFDLSTDRFQPTQAGYYWILGQTRANFVANNDSVHLIVTKNGSAAQTEYVVNRSTSSTSMPLSVGTVVYLNGSTDYVDMQVRLSTTGDIEGAVSYTSLSGFSINSGSLSGGGNDNLGNHIATQNLQLGSNYLSGDGGNEGIGIDTDGNVGIGTTNPRQKMHVEGTFFSSGTVFVGSDSTTNPASSNSVGGTISSLGAAAFSATTLPLAVNRIGSDGAIVSFMQGGSSEGSITVSGTTVSYNAFTGSHFASIEGDIKSGMLVELQGAPQFTHGTHDSEPIYDVELSTRANSKAILGSYLSLVDPGESFGPTNPHQIMSVGNGYLWVSDNGEDIDAGDYLISSAVPGHAEKDLGRYPVAHIVAKAAEAVKWQDVTSLTSSRVRRKLITVTFEQFERSHLHEEIHVLREENKKLLERLRRLEAQMGKILAAP